MPENTTPTQHATRRVAPRGPFVFDLRELGRRPGSMREFTCSVPAPAGFGLDLIAVPQGASLALQLRLESVTEGVLVTGTAAAPLDGQCGRCLEQVSDELVADVCELFAYPDSATDATSKQDEVYRIDGDLLDVEPVVRDAVVLALPWTPLCRPDCPGLCPTCGQRLDELPTGHSHDQIDPRWAALAAFTEAGGPAPGTDRTDEPAGSPACPTAP